MDLYWIPRSSGKELCRYKPRVSPGGITTGSASSMRCGTSQEGQSRPPRANSEPVFVGYTIRQSVLVSASFFAFHGQRLPFISRGSLLA